MMGTLTMRGWVSDPAETIMMLQTYLYENQHSQSRFFNVQSLQYTIQNNMGDINGLAAALEQMYKDHYGPWFDEVDVDVDVSLINDDPDNNGNYRINTALGVYKDGKHYDAGDVFEARNGIVKRLHQINQHGV